MNQHPRITAALAFTGAFAATSAAFILATEAAGKAADAVYRKLYHVA